MKTFALLLTLALYGCVSDSDLEMMEKQAAYEAETKQIQIEMMREME